MLLALAVVRGGFASKYIIFYLSLITYYYLLSILLIIILHGRVEYTYRDLNKHKHVKHTHARQELVERIEAADKNIEEVR